MGKFIETFEDDNNLINNTNRVNFITHLHGDCEARTKYQSIIVDVEKDTNIRKVRLVIERGIIIVDIDILFNGKYICIIRGESFDIFFEEYLGSYILREKYFDICFPSKEKGEYKWLLTTTHVLSPSDIDVYIEGSQAL